MKKIVLIVLLSNVINAYSQEVKGNSLVKEYNIEVAKISDFDKINWKKAYKYFEDSKPNDSIQMKISHAWFDKVKKDLTGKPQEYIVTYKIAGVKSEIDRLVESSKKFKPIKDDGSKNNNINLDSIFYKN